MRRHLAASTYRLQLGPTLSFADAARLVPYLDALGVTDVYLSPPFEAAPDSTHGYDVVTHTQLRTSLGGDEGYAVLAAAIEERGMGQLLDVVPNHMGLGAANAWWMDVLENGPSSVHAPYFDVDWTPVKDELLNKVLVPVLGDQFGAVLERGELRLVRDGGSFFVDYWEHRFPVAPRSVPRILGHRLDELTARVGPDDVDLHELLSINTALGKLAPRSETNAENVAERAREKEVAKRRLAALCVDSEPIRAHVDENIRLFNGDPAHPESFDLLEDLLDHQAYRLAHWRVAGEEINYRRFFDINALGAIRMEDERVFADSHRLVFQLVDEGHVTGLRIDHPDGLYAPSRYFDHLRARCPEALIVVEKILEAGERMPERWNVDGTTGYEFLVCASGLYVDPTQARRFDELTARFVGQHRAFHELVRDKKLYLMRSSMSSEIAMLGRRLNRISERNRRTRDFTLSALTTAITEYIAALPIYRTYVEGTTSADVDARDRKTIEAAIARARRHAHALNPSVFDFLHDVLMLVDPSDEKIEFVRKLQQVTPPVAAKAIEDTAFYCDHRLVALNEVGGDPERFGSTAADFHRLCVERTRRFGGSLSSTSTHDTKRSEDVRLRISALSQLADAWEETLARLADQTRVWKVEREGAGGGEPMPSANDELAFFQAALGVLPEETLAGGPVPPDVVERLAAYMEKALREAKHESSWTNPNQPYEAAMAKVVHAALGSERFVATLRPLAARCARVGRVSSLALCALKLCAPGITDVYQGCELEDLSLVDPDNRRAVDWEGRRALLAALDARLADGPQARLALAREVGRVTALADGRAKLLLLASGLRHRRAHRALYRRGRYLAVEASGPDAHRLVAFARVHDGEALLCVAPRLVAGALGEGDRGPLTLRAELRLPPGLVDEHAPFVDLVTGVEPALGGDSARLPAEALLGDFPVAILASTRR